MTKHGGWIAKYFQRIGFEGKATVDHTTLIQLHRAHMFSVPFENLNIPLGYPIVTDLDALYEKIIIQRRGGFCYELNHLFAHLLWTLGFQVDLLSAGVYNNGTFGPPFDHLCLAVHLNGQRFIADVGYGDSFREPFAMPGETRDALGVGYRVIEAENDLVMQQQKPETDWTDQYRFTLQPFAIEAFQNMCRFQQTSAESSFTRRSICTVARRDGRTTLSNGRLIQTVGDTRHETTLETEAGYREVLAEQFQIELSPSDPVSRLLFQKEAGQT